MRVSDSHCNGCPYFYKAGRSVTNKGGKTTGYCPFKRCVKRYGFKHQQEELKRRLKWGIMLSLMNEG